MPTAARLVSAICLALLAYIVSGQVMEVMPEATDFGVFVPLNIVIGLGVGWIWMGQNLGHGISHAISIGLTAAALLFLVGLFAQSSNEMMRLAMANRYDGAFEAIAGIFVEGLRFGQMMTVDIGITLAVGGIVSGLIANWFARRYS
ncbi:MAG: TrgA family protein [Marinovum sp.]|nr:TrgA family protein [Marinovum sp.]